MDWLHPLMMLLYAVLVVVFLSFVSNRSKQTYSGPSAAKYYINQAKSAVWGGAHSKPSLNLLQRACALIYVKAARKLSNDSDIQRQTGVDPLELQQELLKCDDLLQSFGITSDEFRQLIA
jgi:hypothetical protein